MTRKSSRLRDRPRKSLAEEPIDGEEPIVDFEDQDAYEVEAEPMEDEDEEEEEDAEIVHEDDSSASSSSQYDAPIVSAILHVSKEKYQPRESLGAVSAGTGYNYRRLDEYRRLQPGECHSSMQWLEWIKVARPLVRSKNRTTKDIRAQRPPTDLLQVFEAMEKLSTPFTVTIPTLRPTTRKKPARQSEVLLHYSDAQINITAETWTNGQVTIINNHGRTVDCVTWMNEYLVVADASELNWWKGGTEMVWAGSISHQWGRIRQVSCLNDSVLGVLTWFGNLHLFRVSFESESESVVTKLLPLACISSFAWFEQDRFLLGTDDGMVLIYDLAKDQTIYGLCVTGNGRSVTQVSAKDSQAILIGAMEPRVQVIDLAKAPLQPRTILTSLCYWPLAQWVGEDGAIVCDGENGCRAIDSAGSFPAATHQSNICAMAISEHHNVLATGDAQGNVHLVLLDWPGERIGSEKRIWNLSRKGDSFSLTLEETLIIPQASSQTILPPDGCRVRSMAWSNSPITPGLLAMAVDSLVMVGAVDYHLIALELTDNERNSSQASSPAKRRGRPPKNKVTEV